MEIYSLLYGYISGVYKDLGANSYMMRKFISRGMCDIYDNCMTKDNDKSIYMIFFEPISEILSHGTEK